MIAHELGHITGGHIIRIREGYGAATQITLLSMLAGIGAALVAAASGRAGAGYTALTAPGATPTGVSTEVVLRPAPAQGWDRDVLADLGYDPQLGARPMRRAIQRHIEDVLSEKILYKSFSAGEIIVVDVEDDPDNPGRQRFTFDAVEGFVPPSSVELATTATDEPQPDTDN